MLFVVVDLLFFTKVILIYDKLFGKGDLMYYNCLCEGDEIVELQHNHLYFIWISMLLLYT